MATSSWEPRSVVPDDRVGHEKDGVSGLGGVSLVVSSRRDSSWPAAPVSQALLLASQARRGSARPWRLAPRDGGRPRRPQGEAWMLLPGYQHEAGTAPRVSAVSFYGFHLVEGRGGWEKGILKLVCRPQISGVYPSAVDSFIGLFRKYFSLFVRPRRGALTLTSVASHPSTNESISSSIRFVPPRVTLVYILCSFKHGCLGRISSGVRPWETLSETKVH